MVSLIRNSTLGVASVLKPGASVVFRGPRYGDPKVSQVITGTHISAAFDSMDYRPHSYSANGHNELLSLVHRHLIDTPRCTPLVGIFNRWVQENVQILFRGVRSSRPAKFHDYLAKSNAAPGVKRVLAVAHANLVDRGIDEWSRLTVRDCRRWCLRSSFVKRENDLLVTSLGETEKPPRLIQGGQPEYVCLMGPAFMSFQSRLKKFWDGKKFPICFTSGKNSLELGDLIPDNYVSILKNDISKFDASLSLEMCEVEMFLVRYFKFPRAVAQLFECNIVKRGLTSNGYYYKVPGTRASGDPFTSCFNSIINGLMHLFIGHMHFNGPLEDYLKTFMMLVQGDDNLTFFKNKVDIDYDKFLLELGFKSKASIFEHYSEAEFCSCRLYRNNGRFLFGPKPGRVLAKFGYFVDPPRGVPVKGLLRGVALGLWNSVSFIPPLRSLVERVLELTVDSKPVFGKLLEHVITMPIAIDPAMDVYETLDYNYFFGPSCQDLYSSFLNRLLLGDKNDHPYSCLLMDRDTGGPSLIFP